MASTVEHLCKALHNYFTVC